MKFIRILILVVFISPLILTAQDYTKQFEALKQSIEAKNVDALKPFISLEMAIPSLITKEQLTPALLERVLKDVFGRISSVSLKDSENGEMTVFYDFIDEINYDL